MNTHIHEDKKLVKGIGSKLAVILVCTDLLSWINKCHYQLHMWVQIVEHCGSIWHRQFNSWTETFWSNPSASILLCVWFGKCLLPQINNCAGWSHLQLNWLLLTSMSLIVSWWERLAYCWPRTLNFHLANRHKSFTNYSITR